MARKKKKMKLRVSKREPLSVRETEVCSLIAKDYSNDAISKKLGISLVTVQRAH